MTCHGQPYQNSEKHNLTRVKVHVDSKHPFIRVGYLVLTCVQRLEDSNKMGGGGGTIVHVLNPPLGCRERNAFPPATPILRGCGMLRQKMWCDTKMPNQFQSNLQWNCWHSINRTREKKQRETSRCVFSAFKRLQLAAIR